MSKKTNRNIGLFLGATLSIALAYTFNEFNKLVEVAKTDTYQIQSESKIVFLAYKDSIINTFEIEKNKKQVKFNDVYNIQSCTNKHSIEIAYFLFDTEIYYSTYSKDYLPSLKLLSICEIHRENTYAIVDSKLNEILKEYSINETFISQFEKEKFIKTEEIFDENQRYFPHLKDYSIAKGSFGKFKNLADQLTKEISIIEISNISEKFKAINAKRSFDYNLTYEGKNLFKEFIDGKDFLLRRTHTISLNDDYFGTTNYEVNTITFDQEAFDKGLNKIYKKQYANNSLRTGSQPYGYCYGYNRDCSRNGCSSIKVTGPNNSDVLVLIKKNNRVYRHSYIKAGGRITLSMPNGRYQAFFYYGKGWNPTKLMKNVNGCGRLKGGFTSNESFDKDDAQYLRNNILTYKLIVTTNGTFQTKPSNMNEAL